MSPAQSPAAGDISTFGVLVVGGSSGIGRAAARAFVEAGAPRVVIVGRNSERGQSVCDDLRESATGSVDFVAADVTDPQQVEYAVRESLSLLTRIDVVINAAGAEHLPTLLHRTAVADIPRILSDIAAPAMLMTRAVLPHMASQSSGCVINVASDAAKVPTPGESVIGAAMAAIVVFSRTAAVEAKRNGVRVNVLTPSLVEGTRTTDRLFDDEFSARLFGKARELADLGVSTPEDQAALMVFLAGPGGQRITGQAISVNGGISAG